MLSRSEHLVLLPHAWKDERNEHVTTNRSRRRLRRRLRISRTTVAITARRTKTMIPTPMNAVWRPLPVLTTGDTELADKRLLHLSNTEHTLTIITSRISILYDIGSLLFGWDRGWAKSSVWAVAETKRKIRLCFLAHLRLNVVLGSAKRLSHGLSAEK